MCVVSQCFSSNFTHQSIPITCKAEDLPPGAGAPEAKRTGGAQKTQSIFFISLTRPRALPETQNKPGRIKPDGSSAKVQQIDGRRRHRLQRRFKASGVCEGCRSIRQRTEPALHLHESVCDITSSDTDGQTTVDLLTFNANKQQSSSLPDVLLTDPRSKTVVSHHNLKGKPLYKLKNNTHTHTVRSPLRRIHTNTFRVGNENMKY